jgi:hypothetical protein
MKSGLPSVTCSWLWLKPMSGAVSLGHLALVGVAIGSARIARSSVARDLRRGELTAELEYEASVARKKICKMRICMFRA